MVFLLAFVAPNIVHMWKPELGIKISDQILQAAFSLFMKYGVRSVSMDDLANDLGMSKKTIYNTFPSKEDLIIRVIKIHLDRDEKEITKIIRESGDAIEEMVAISNHVLQFLMQIKPSLIFDLKKFYPSCWDLIEKRHFSFVRQTIRKNIERGQAEHLYRKDINPDILSKIYVSLSNAVINPDVFPLSEYDILDLIKETLQYHLHGIVSVAGKEKLQTKSIYSK